MKIEKGFISVAAIAIVAFIATALPVNAGTKVIQIDDETLKVIVIKGKPPHKRFVVKKNIAPSLYYRYCQQLDECQATKAQMAPGHK